MKTLTNEQIERQIDDVDIGEFTGVVIADVSDEDVRTIGALLGKKVAVLQAYNAIR